MRYDLLAARILVTAVLVAAAFFGLRWTWLQYEVEPWTRDGRLRADIVQVTPDVSGLVTAVMVHDNQAVKKGQVLLVLDQPRYQYALDQAEAALAVQKAALAEAEREDHRNHSLSQLVATELLEQGSARVDQLQASLNQAVANRNLAKLNLERTTVYAPVDGIVTNMELQPGDYATAGHQAMALVYTASIRVEGYFEETKLPAIRVGDPARVWLMGADEPIRGHVESISGGIEDRELGASGTMLANVNPTFSWVRLPQRIPVRIALDKVPEHMRLVPGRTATVEVDFISPAGRPPEISVVRRWVPWIAVLTLSACTVGPDYKVPDEAKVNAPSARGDLIAAKSTKADEPPDDWWKLYSSPVLDGLIQEALAANTDLRAAEANLERTQGLLDQTEALKEPSVAFNLDTNYNQRSAEAYVHAGDIPAAQLYDTGLSISYDLDLFGRLRRMSEAASDQADVARAARDLVKINVAADMARAYADLCNAGEQLDATRHVVALQDQYLALTHMAVAAGRREQIEIEQQEAAAEQARASLPSLEARQKNALFRIATLAGKTPAEFDAGLMACHRSLDLDAALPVGDGAGLLARRPDVRAAERRLAASTAQIGVATADLYPTVRLGATVGTTGAVSDFMIDRTNRYSGGPGISWQLNQSIPRAKIAVAKAGAKADLARFDGAVLTALRETDSALNVYDHDQARLAKLKAARDRSARAAEDARTLRAGGRLDALTAVAAERAQANAEQTVAAAKGQISADEMVLFLALGGGWNDPKPPSS